jgi:Mrp family chromosome partitioning ATPase
MAFVLSAASTRLAAGAAAGAGLRRVGAARAPLQLQQQALALLRSGAGAVRGVGSDSRVVCITSGKGGVGKTTTAASIGMGLAMKGHKTCVIDFDIGLRNLDIHLVREGGGRKKVDKGLLVDSG